MLAASAASDPGAEKNPRTFAKSAFVTTDFRRRGEPRFRLPSGCSRRAPRTLAFVARVVVARTRIAITPGK
jgi:hypothetical protein